MGQGMATVPRIVRSYECLGGPLDGQTRTISIAQPPPSAPVGYRPTERLYIVRRDDVPRSGDDLTQPQRLLEAIVPPPPSAGSFSLLGYYTVQSDENARRGSRDRLRWTSLAPWPPHVIIPWTPEKDPPPDFTQDTE